MRSHNREPKVDGERGREPFFLGESYQAAYQKLRDEGWNAVRAQSYLLDLIPSKDRVEKELEPEEIQRLFLLYNFLRSQGETFVTAQFEEHLSAYAAYHYIPKIQSILKGEYGEEIKRLDLNLEDIGQDLYLRLRKKAIASFNYRLGFTFKSFFTAAALNAFRDEVRSKKRQRSREASFSALNYENDHGEMEEAGFLETAGSRPVAQSLPDRGFTTIEFGAIEADSSHGPLMGTALVERRQLLRQLIPRLLDACNGNDRQLLQLVFLGMTYGEIAEFMGLNSIGTVKSRLSLLRNNRLNKILDEDPALAPLKAILNDMLEEER